MTGADNFMIGQRVIPDFEADTPWILIYLQKNIRNLESLVDGAVWYRQNYPDSKSLREDTLIMNRTGNFETTPLEYLNQMYEWAMEDSDINTVQNLFVNLAISGKSEDLMRIGDVYNDTWIASRNFYIPCPGKSTKSTSTSLLYRRVVIGLAPVFVSRGFKC